MSKLHQEFSKICRFGHYSLATERQYWAVARKFIRDSEIKTREDLTISAETKISKFLSKMANRGAAASTHSVALNALVFLYTKVLKYKLAKLPDFSRPTKPARLPSVPISHEATMKLIDALPGQMNLIARLLYGAAMRVSDALRLRLRDLDFTQNEILIRAGKGDKDRLVPMPKALISELSALQIRRGAEHLSEVRAGRGWVFLPGLYGVKNPKAHYAMEWQYLFASEKYSVDPRNKNIGRHHITPEAVQQAFRVACDRLGLQRSVTPHGLRHASARTMYKRGVSLVSIQAVLGHKDCETTMRYLGAGAKIPAAISPLD